MKENFYQLKTIESSVNAERHVIEGTLSASPVLSPGASNEPDHNDIIYGTVYKDVDGSIFGDVGRTHCWYQSGNRAGSPTMADGTCYAYSDDDGATWTKPNLGQVSYNGSTNNNLVVGYRAMVTVDPSDAPNPVRFLNRATYVGGKGSKTTGWVTSGPAYGGNDVAAIHIAHGATLLMHQYLYIPSGSFTVANSLNVHRVSAINKTTEVYGSSAWHYSTGSFTQSTMPAASLIPVDKSNLPTGFWETYIGSFAQGFTNIDGTTGHLLWPSYFKRNPDSDYRTGICHHGIASITDVTDDDFEMIGTDSNFKIFSPGAIGSLTGGFGLMQNGIVETADTIYAFPTIAEWPHGGLYNPPVEEAGWDSYWAQFGYDNFRYRMYRLEWPKDRMVKMALTSGEIISVPMTKAEGKGLRINYNGAITAELQDGSGTPIPGFTESDCDLANTDTLETEITWGGKSGTSISGAVKIRLTGTGDVHAYWWDDAIAADYINVGGIAHQELSGSETWAGPVQKRGGKRYGAVLTNDSAKGRIAVQRGGVKYYLQEA